MDGSLWIVFNSIFCVICRFAIDKMQSACLDEYGGEKAVDLSTQETTVIQHIFGGRLQSQVSYVSSFHFIWNSGLRSMYWAFIPLL